MAVNRALAEPPPESYEERVPAGRFGTNKPFSPEAREFARVEVERYERDMDAEATRLAGQAERVLEKDVAQACDSLRPRRNTGAARRTGTIGGLLLGGAISAVIGAFYAPQPTVSHAALVATFLPGTIGALFLGHHLRCK